MLKHVGKYEIRKLLGKGATGSVYLAADPFGQREVAVKVMDGAPADPEEARRQLRFNEAFLAIMAERLSMMGGRLLGAQAAGVL